MRRAGTVLCALVACAAAMAIMANVALGSAVVSTDQGQVRGVETPTAKKFLGIPYAAPPVGDLRWRPPAPAARWGGPLDASRFGNHCPQPASPFGQASTTEDCLYLNVYTPNRKFAQGKGQGKGLAKKRLPVMVWIHGGALAVGESDDYDPTRLVEQGAIVVTINYRLGWLGFLAHPALSAESGDQASGNYGLMDQQAALRWVQRNIARFGGEPEQRDDLRRVGRRSQRPFAPGLAAVRRPLPPRRSPRAAPTRSTSRRSRPRRLGQHVRAERVGCADPDAPPACARVSVGTCSRSSRPLPGRSYRTSTATCCRGRSGRRSTAATSTACP